MLDSKLLSLLFIAGQPMSIKKMAHLCDVEEAEAEKALENLRTEFQKNNFGLWLLKNGKEYQLSSNPENANLVQKFLKEEVSGELTPPQLETLTIIAYREPILKAELEQIRGVNCSLILRNLLIRGLINTEEEKKTGTMRYRLSFDFLRYLGVSSVSELPDYEKLHKSEIVEKMLEAV